MVKKRDGPAPQETTPSQEQGVNERALPLPQPKSPRNTRAHPTPSKIRSRRRQGDPSWREFHVRLFSKPDSEGVHALHVYLRTMARRYGLTIVEINEVRDRGEET